MKTHFPVPALRFETAVRARVASDDPLLLLLYDRLCWLRNHYDVGSPKVKADVLRDIDATLAFVEQASLTVAD